MIAPTPSQLELIHLLCLAREGESQGLPDGCMPGSMCAAAHLYPYAFWVTVVTGFLIGVFAVRAWQAYLKNKQETE